MPSQERSRSPDRRIQTHSSNAEDNEDLTGLLAAADDGAECNQTDEIRQRAVEFVRWRCYWSKRLEETSVRKWQNSYAGGKKQVT